ncbi:MAG TPA: hypothetical protein VFJ06_12565 [Halococcus sp.]|nr:hypothetical protein [Halococcus sp.]
MIPDPEGRDRVWAVRTGTLPRREYNRTEAVIRMQWRYAWRESEEVSVGIGAVLSSVLNHDTRNSTLAAFGDGIDHDYRPTALYYADNGMHWDEFE